jgi:FkbM family methyltransferase
MTVDLDRSRFSVHHIGGRGGSRSFPIMAPFEKDVVNVLYEADQACVQQIRDSNLNLPSELHVLPYCLGQTEGPATFHINLDSFTSSLLELAPDYGGYYLRQPDHDYVFAEAIGPVETRAVETISLDQVIARNASVPPPNFLSIDTQGSEHEILLGATGALKSDVIAALVETAFSPMYAGQKTFGDILALLSDRGFHFVKFSSWGQVSPYRGPIGLRADGFHLFDDALFFRRVDDIEKMDADPRHRWLLLNKLAFVSIVYRQFEYALQCLQAVQRLNDPRWTSFEGPEPSYIVFLRALWGEIGKMPESYPRSFAAKHSLAESKARSTAPRPIKSVVLNLAVAAKNFAIYSDVETLLMKYGFSDLANVLKHNRLVETAVGEFLKDNPAFEDDYAISQVEFKVEG